MTTVHSWILTIRDLDPLDLAGQSTELLCKHAKESLKVSAYRLLLRAGQADFALQIRATRPLKVSRSGVVVEPKRAARLRMCI